MSVKVESRTSLAEESGQKGNGGALAATLLRDVRLMLIALWLGAAVFFSAAVAPAAFGVLRGRGVANANELAGSIVTRTLSIVNTSGFLISLLLLASAFLFRRRLKRAAFYAETCALVFLALVTGLGHWVINARLLALRLAMNRPIDQVDQTDPLRVAFNNLHGYSVLALGLGILAAAIVLLLIARRARTD